MAQLEQRAETAERLLHDLTPMGSEYAGDPMRCYVYARDHASDLQKMLVEAIGKQRQLECTVGDLDAQIQALTAEMETNKAAREAYKASFAESVASLCWVEQVLGKALGYPRYKDDAKHFPDATESDGVCVGDNTAESLADEIVKRLAEAKEDARQVMDDYQDLGRVSIEREDALKAEVENLTAALREQEETTARWQDAANMDQVLVNLRRAETAEQQLAASQAEVVALRLVLEKARTPSRFYPEKVSYCPVCDQGETVGEIEHQPHEPDCIIGQVLATPSAVAERARVRDAKVKECLEGIIANRVADGGVCNARDAMAGCGCSECLAREALAALGGKDAEGQQ